MIDIAIKMLLGDRMKYSLLVSGVCFSSLLIGQGLSMFFGILAFSYATLDNIRAPLWVVNPLVEAVQDNQPLRDTDIDRVRSVDGVAWAAPLYVGFSQARILGSGVTKQATLVGIDPSTLATVFTYSSGEGSNCQCCAKPWPPPSPWCRRFVSPTRSTTPPRAAGTLPWPAAPRPPASVRLMAASVQV